MSAPGCLSTLWTRRCRLSPASCGSTTARNNLETEAAGWSGRLVYVRVNDRRYRLTSVWLNAADVQRGSCWAPWTGTAGTLVMSHAHSGVFALTWFGQLGYGQAGGFHLAASESGPGCGDGGARRAGGRGKCCRFARSRTSDRNGGRTRGYPARRCVAGAGHCAARWLADRGIRRSDVCRCLIDRRTTYDPTRGAAVAWAAVPIVASTLPVIVVLLLTGVLPSRPLAVIPVSGILIGGAMTASTLAGIRALDELSTRRGEVEAALSLGLLPRDAALEICRPAAASAMVPVLDQTRTVGLVTLPGAFVGMLLGGASPVAAGAVQLFVLVSLLAVEAAAVALTAETVARSAIQRIA
jgi:hypothetical protein